MRADYVLYKSCYQGRLFWRARFFWDEQTGKYLKSRNLDIPVEGKWERRRDAEEAAEKMAAKMQKEKFQPSHFPVAETSFLSYLVAFWSPDSDYIAEQAKVNNTPLSAMYLKNNQNNIRNHISVCPLLQNITLSELTRKIIRSYKLWAAKRDLSGSLINKCLQTMRVAVRYAVANGDIHIDPFFGAGKAYHEEKPKGIITFEEREKLVHGKVLNYYSRLAVLLGCLCGLRRGEIRGLRWGDISDGIITIQHNWVDGDGAKYPKRKGGTVQKNTRTVFLPRAIANLLCVISAIAGDKLPDDFVIQSKSSKGKPVSSQFFALSLDKELSAIGIPGEWPRNKKNEKPVSYVNEQKKRNITFHSLRHCFVTCGRLAGLTDPEIQALAGHGPRMMDRYSHVEQVINMRQVGEKLEKSLIAAPLKIANNHTHPNSKRLNSQNQSV